MLFIWNITRYIIYTIYITTQFVDQNDFTITITLFDINVRYTTFLQDLYKITKVKFALRFQYRS